MKQVHAFRLDPVNHRLWRGDERVTMTPKAFLINGNDPWILVFREAWLRTVVLDFDGARRLCDTIADTAVTTPEMPSQRTSPSPLSKPNAADADPSTSSTASFLIRCSFRWSRSI
jgi:hypothetical protein